MYAERFPHGTGDFPVLQTSGAGCAAPRSGRRSVARCAGGCAFRCGGDRVCTGVFAGCGQAGDVGFRPDVAAREWAIIWACAAQFRVQGQGAEGGGQPSARCALGDGGGGLLCRAVGGCGRNSRCARGAEFYSDQAVGVARRGLRRPDLVDPFGGSRRAFGGARTLAVEFTTCSPTSLRPRRPRCTTMGGRAVSRPWPRARCLECSL